MDFYSCRIFQYRGLAQHDGLFFYQLVDEKGKIKGSVYSKTLDDVLQKLVGLTVSKEVRLTSIRNGPTAYFPDQGCVEVALPDADFIKLVLSYDKQTH